MERFIADPTTLPYHADGYLKSSMERFIVLFLSCYSSLFIYLKSSMERFIEVSVFEVALLYRDLKSSMERFIVLNILS